MRAERVSRTRSAAALAVFLALPAVLSAETPAASPVPPRAPAVQPKEEKPVSAYKKLEALGLTLPDVTPPVAAFVPFVQTGKLVYLSGRIARKDGKPWAGRLGAGLSTPDGALAARGIALEMLSVLHTATGGALDRIRRIVKLLVLVNSDPGFTEQHLVANGASQLLQDVLGPAGAHARSAVGVAQLPLGACVEIELIAELE